MSVFRMDKKVLKNCKIYQMLLKSSKKKHLPFHMPGHKMGKWDITELSYSDNLSAPRGCIMEAQKDIAALFGAKQSFILTDGSTSGVLAMLYAAKTLGVKTVAVYEKSHKSVFNGCKLMDLTPLVYAAEWNGKIPYHPTMSALKTKNPAVLEKSDALFFTSPDYFGNVADMAALREYCDQTGKLLLIDGAHGGHLHFDKKIYGGAYADFWVDGVHKSLPCLTQGAIVSARDEKTADALLKGVEIFRTTSPSYPIMASVEYGAKYPRNVALENAVHAFIDGCDRVYPATDWTKLSVFFGKYAFDAQRELESRGIYPEFCDGLTVMFYLSPCTKIKDFKKLKKTLIELFEKYPFEGLGAITQNGGESAPAPMIFNKDAETEWVSLHKSIGRVCANDCGLFPPCSPLIKVGEVVTEEKISLLNKADNVYGLVDMKILVIKNEGE